MIKTFYKNLTSARFALRSMAGGIEHLNIFSLFVVALLIIFYLILSNNVATENYRKITLQKHIDNLRAEIKNLNLELTDKRSIGFLKKSAQNLNLIISEDIQYIKVAGPVAKNP